MVSTIRRTEVAADPTNLLALEAAVRRSRGGPAGCVRLATVQRVLRAQRFADPGAQAHFTLFGLVSAGRDTGNLAFERRHAVEHLRFHAAAAVAAGHRPRVRLTSLGSSVLVPAITKELPDVAVLADPDRESGRGYYTELCFKVDVASSDGWREVADGGFVDWTVRLLGDRKERLLISGVGVDGLAVG
ncbi:MAG: hypothetical protein ACRDTU_16190 [Micromonosporaceae bacterium]